MTRFAAFFACLGAASAFLAERDIISSLGPQLSPGAAIYSPNSPQWANETARWSTFDQPTFINVVVPATQADIVATVNYATSNNITFLAQGGGHGYSTTLKVITGAIMINMQNFDYAIADTPSTMRVGGGTHYGTLIPALYNAGAELPVGVSPCVGATGATIGGGVGRLGGLHGLMIDAVSSFRMVLASGQVANVSSSSYPDLFYGMKGAGQLYGIIVETIFDTYPASNGGNFYNVDMVFAGSQLESTLSVVNSIIPNQPGELALIVLFNHGTPDPIIKVNLVYAGSRSAGLKYSQMFNATNPQSFNESMITFADLPAKSAGGAFNLSCGKGLRKNNYSVNMKNFNLTTMRFVFNQYTDFLAANPNANQSAWLIEVFGQAGENAVPADSSAYPNRGFDNIRPIIGATYSDDSVAEAADKYLQTVRDACAATSGYGKLRVYQNYAHGDEPLESMYGYEKGRLQKLQCLKAKYDPDDVFKGYHDIPIPTKGSC